MQLLRGFFMHDHYRYEIIFSTFASAKRNLGVGGAAQTVYGKAIFSRVADLAVVDMLYMAVILSDYERFSHNLDHSGQVIADRDYPDQ